MSADRQDRVPAAGMLTPFRRLLRARRRFEDKASHRDFSRFSAEHTLAELQALPPSQRRDAALGLLYRKALRPESLGEQAKLLRALPDHADFSTEDRIYCLVAAAHKACECTDAAMARDLLPQLAAAYDHASRTPYRKALRRDGLHMRFSVLNVVLNASLLVQSDDTERWADTALHALRAIDPRRTSPYLFNSTSNIVKTVLLAALLRPDTLREMPALLDALLDHSLLSQTAQGDRKKRPARLQEITPRRAYTEFKDTVARLLALQDAVDRDLDPEALTHIAALSVGQRVPEQKAALLAAITARCADRWRAISPRWT